MSGIRQSDTSGRPGQGGKTQQLTTRFPKSDKAASRGVLSYEVFAKKQDDRTFKKVNSNYLILCVFSNTIESAAGTSYKVRMVDYWNRKGKFSDVILVE